MKSKLFALLMFTFGSMGAKAENIPDLLVVWMKDGSKPTLALNKKPNITFTSEDLIIKTDQLEVAYDRSQLVRMTYEKNDVTGVTELATGKFSLSFKGNALYFPYLSAQSKVEIYKTDGVQILSRSVEKSGPYSFSLGRLGTGTFLVTVNGVTYKIMKR